MLPGTHWDNQMGHRCMIANPERENEGGEGSPSAERQREEQEWLRKLRTVSGQEKNKTKQKHGSGRRKSQSLTEGLSPDRGLGLAAHMVHLGKRGASPRLSG